MIDRTREAQPLLHWAARLGYAGLLPFVILAMAAWIAPPAYRAQAGHALRGLPALFAVLICAIPLLVGFLLPAGLLFRLALAEGDAQFGRIFLVLAGNSFVLAGVTAVLAVALAVLLAYAARVSKGLVAGVLNRLVGLGYAVPGSVIAVGVLIPVTRLDNWLLAQWTAWFGSNPGLLLTGGIAALIYAYLVRFLAVALQKLNCLIHLQKEKKTPL